MNGTVTIYDNLLSPTKSAQKRQLVEYKVLPNEANV
jgi:hypothetical protein